MLSDELLETKTIFNQILPRSVAKLNFKDKTIKTEHFEQFFHHSKQIFEENLPDSILLAQNNSEIERVTEI